MKILFVCHRLPFPPSRGGKIRPFNIIKHLHNQGHQVTVASIARSRQEFDEGAGLADYCSAALVETITGPLAWARMFARVPTPTPSSMGYFYSPRLAARIRQAQRDTGFDFVFVHCSSVAGYVADLPIPARMFDLGDVDSQKWLAYAKHRRMPRAAGYWFEGVKLERAEQRLAKHFDFCTCTTRAELETFDGFATGVNSGWFPNGVDTGYFPVSPDAYDPNLICFVGRMDYYPNQEAMLTFCHSVWPVIRRQRPATRLRIVGASPSAAIRALGDIPGVDVTGSVADVRPHVGNAALTVAPLSIARGTQNKILESMAMGVPVVASTQAAPGVDAVPGEHLLVATEPRDYCHAIIRLLDNPEERNRIAKAARERVLENHSWEKSMCKLDGLIEECLAIAVRRNPGSRKGSAVEPG